MPEESRRLKRAATEPVEAGIQRTKRTWVERVSNVIDIDDETPDIYDNDTSTQANDNEWPGTRNSTRVDSHASPVTAVTRTSPVSNTTGDPSSGWTAGCVRAATALSQEECTKLTNVATGNVNSSIDLKKLTHNSVTAKSNGISLKDQLLLPIKGGSLRATISTPKLAALGLLLDISKRPASRRLRRYLLSPKEFLVPLNVKVLPKAPFEVPTGSSCHPALREARDGKTKLVTDPTILVSVPWYWINIDKKSSRQLVASSLSMFAGEFILLLRA
jgi:hypothetical protein